MTVERKLLQLAGRARAASSPDALQFLLLNETFQLVQYRQAVLWSRAQGVMGVSGVSSVDRNSSFVLWIKTLFLKLSSQQTEIVRVEPDTLSADLLGAWSDWLPKFALWLPLPAIDRAGAGLLLCRDEPWSDRELYQLKEWLASWQQCWQLLSLKSRRSLSWGADNGSSGRPGSDGWWGRFWRNRIYRYGLLLVLVGLIPVPLTVLAPAEIVPREPAVIRVPIDGVIEDLLAMPNQWVNAGEPLVRLDLTSLMSQLRVAEQESLLALAIYRQAVLQSLTDAERLAQLAEQDSQTIQRQIQTDYLQQMLERATITAPRSGIVIFDDPMQLIGRPVATGEKIMVVAQPEQVEIEIWLALNDMIAFSELTTVVVHLNATPFKPVKAQVESIGHTAIQRPDGTYAYRVRARLDNNQQPPRIGLRGTARLAGDRVTLAYWVFRKPIIAVRQFLGI